MRQALMHPFGGVRRDAPQEVGEPVRGWTGTRAYASPTIRGYLARFVLIVRHAAVALLFLSNVVAAQFGDPVVVLEPLECDPGVVEVADMDADGDADLVFRLCEGTQTHLVWLPNEMNSGHFSDPILIGSMDVPNALVSYAVADLNGDGALDIVAAWSRSISGGAGEPFRFDWFENRNGGSDFTGWDLPMDYPSATIEVRDVDGDGDLDLLAWSDILTVLIWRLVGETEIVSGVFATEADPYLLRASQLMGGCGADLLMQEDSPGGKRIVLLENRIAVSTPAEPVSPGPAARVGPVFPNPAGAEFWLPAVGLAPGPAPAPSPVCRG